MTTQRSRIIEEILNVVSPHLWQSGYVNHDGSPVRLFAFDETQEIEGYTVSAIDGFTEDGIIDAAYAGGLGVSLFSSMSLADLRLVRDLARKTFRKGAAAV